ncbi:MAG: acylphosphatase [Patescibacteria group bacterium]
MKAFEAKIYGRVQMVMFRDFVQRKASARNITGWVKNNPDKTVSVYAEGEERKVEELLLLLKKGPIFAKVEKVERRDVSPLGMFQNFSIQYK